MPNSSKPFADGLSLRLAVRRLFEREGPPTFKHVWLALTQEERARSLYILLWHPSIPGSTKALIRKAAVRKGALPKRPDAQVAAAAARDEPTHLPITDALRELHLADRRPMLIAFLEALGIAHENGLTNSDIVIPGGPDAAERISAAIEQIVGRFPADQIGLYLMTLLAIEPKRWSVLTAWRARGLLELSTAPTIVVEVPKGRPKYAMLEGNEPLPDPANSPRNEDAELSEGIDDSAATKDACPARAIEPERTDLENLRVSAIDMGGTLAELADDLETEAVHIRSGTRPSSAIQARMQSAGEAFDTLSSRVADAADSIALPAPSEVKDLPALIETLDQILEYSQTSIRLAVVQRAVQLLADVSRIRHVRSDFPPLAAVAIDARRLSELATRGSENAEVDAVSAGQHGLVSLLRLVRDGDKLDRTEINELAASVEAAYGPDLALQALRGRLELSETTPDEGDGVSPRPTSRAHAPAAIGVETGLTHGDLSPDVTREILDLSKASTDDGSNGQPRTSDAHTDPVSVKPDRDFDSVLPDVAPELKPPAATISTSIPTARFAIHELQPQGDDHAESSRTSSGSGLVATHFDTEAQTFAAAQRLAAWRALAGSEPSLAYYHLRVAEERDPASEPVFPSSLVRAVSLSSRLRDPVGAIGDQLRMDLASVDLGELLRQVDDNVQQALRLLIVAASLRSALLAPDTGAPQLLTELRHDGGYERLWELCQRIAEFGQGGFGLSPEILSRVMHTHEWEDEVALMREEVRSWLADAPNHKLVFTGATNVWRKWLERGQLIDVLLRPVVENDVAALSRVRERLEQFDSIAAIRRSIEHTDRDELRRPRGPEIQARALAQLETRALEAIEFARRWSQLQAINPKGGEGWRLQQADRLRSAVQDLQGAVFRELETASVKSAGPSSEIGRAAIAGGIASCVVAVRDLVSIFNAQQSEGRAELTPQQLLSLPLLMRPDVRVAADGEVALDDPARLAKSLFPAEGTAQERWVRAFEKRLAQDDFVGTQLLLDRRAFLGVAEIDDRLRSEREEALEHRRSSARYRANQVEKEIAYGASRGYLRMDDHGRLLSEIRTVHQMLPTVIDFETIDTKLATVERTVHEFRLAAIAEVRDRLKKATALPDAIRNRAEQLLGRGDVLTATELIEQADNHPQLDDWAPDDDAAPHLAGFLRFLRRTSSLDPDLGAGGLAALPAEDGENGDAVDPSSQELRVALRAWTERKRNNVDRGLPNRIFTLLGFTVDTADAPEKVGRYWWTDVHTTAVRNRASCPVPYFGSRAAGHYRVLWLDDQPNEDDIATAVAEAEGTRDRAVIVFYFGRLDEARRRALRAVCYAQRSRFVVLDDVALAYVARQPGARMSAFFAATLPFTHLVPYHTNAGEVPPEMFYGRRDERQQIQDRDGSCFVFGGRQLGKTALLKDVQRTFHDKSVGHVGVYVDLKHAGVGSYQPAEAVWVAIADELRRVGITISDGSPSAKRDPRGEAGVVEDAVHAWIKRAPAENRILTLLDESDLFFEKDGADGHFTQAHKLKNLMERTNRSFKVVFAGLHNVQRTTRIANHPLAHLGEPICVGPMLEGSEWLSAVQLVEDPLKALGYKIDRDLTIRILGHTNYYPSLIQLYCGELVRHLGQRATRLSVRSSAFPTEVSSEHVDEAYRSGELRQRIRESFDLTLNLDPRYRVIALAIAYATSTRELSLSWPGEMAVRDLYDVVMSAWSEGFSADPSEDTFRALLDEMVGLGVLRRGAEGRYALRGANVPLLLGSEEEVYRKLTSLDPPSTYDVFDANTFRRPLRDAVGSQAERRAPFTTQQEYELRARSNGLALVCGVPAGGLQDVVAWLSDDSRARTDIMGVDSRLDDLIEHMQVLAKSSVVGTTLVVVPLEVSWTEEWVHRAHELLRSRSLRDRFTRIAFVAGPARLWDTLRDHGGQNDALDGLRSLGIVVQTLRPWRDAAVRQWAEELQRGTASGPFALGSVRDRTGNWAGLLTEYLRIARTPGKPDAPDPAAEFLNYLTRDGVLVRWLDAFGLTIGEPAALYFRLTQIARADGPVSLEDLEVFGEMTRKDALLVTAWAETLGLVERSLDSRGVTRWTPDRIVGVLASAGMAKNLPKATDTELLIGKA